MKVAYVRVSTVDQNEERQVKALEPLGIEKWFVEKVSAKDTNRPELQRMLEFVREGDVVCIHDFSRLARNTQDLLGIVDGLQKKGVEVVSNKEQIDTSTPTGKLMLTLIAAISEFERSILLERQREGIAIAKSKGKYQGRKAIEVPKEKYREVYCRYMRREITKSAMAKELGVSRPTLDKIMKEKSEE